MNKSLMILFLVLLSFSAVSAFQPLSREYFYMEEKEVEIGDTFEIMNRGIFTLRHASGMIIEVGVARPTGDKIDCSDYDEFGGSCGLVSFNVNSEVFDGVGDASVRPGENGIMSTPFFDIVPISVENNEKFTDAVYTIKIVENKPSMLYVSANTNFTLLPNQAAKRGVYEIQNLGISDDGRVFLYFTRNGEKYAPSQELFSDGGYIPKMIMGNYWEKAYTNKPLTCLEPDLCLFYYSSNLLDYKTKNSYSTALMGEEMTLALMEMKAELPAEQEIDLPENTEDEEQEQIFPANEEIEPLIENIPNPELIAEEQSPESEAEENNPIKVAPEEGLSQESTGLFKSIGKFFKSIFGRK